MKTLGVRPPAPYGRSQKAPGGSPGTPGRSGSRLPRPCGSRSAPLASPGTPRRSGSHLQGPSSLSPGEGQGEGGSAPRAFTLVEILVVIAIIGMVAALAVPTIFSAVASARNAKTKAEIDMLHVALMNYKNEYGSFPPAYFGAIPDTPQPIALNNATTYKKHPVYRHLSRIFPRISEPAAKYAELADLSPAQALVFWLQGFYQSPEYPLSAGGSRLRLFDFEESRLYKAITVAGMPQSFSARDSAAAYPVYFTGHPNSGLPYVYFDSRCYDNPPPANDIGYSARSTNGNDSIARPYVSSMPPANPTWGQQHMCGETFQIIAAGPDGDYGTGQAAFPTPTSYVPPSWPALTFNSVTNPTDSRGHADNVTNFADRPLADAVEVLKSQ